MSGLGVARPRECSSSIIARSPRVHRYFGITEGANIIAELGRPMAVDEVLLVIQVGPHVCVCVCVCVCV